MGFCALRGVEGRGGGNTDRREVLRGRGGFHSVRRRPCQILAATRSTLETARKAAEGLAVEFFVLEDMFAGIPAAGGRAGGEIWREGEDLAFIVYTSGTTGAPKGVMLTFANMYANMKAVEEAKYYFDGIRVLIMLPFHHILPLMGTLVMPLYVGGQMVFPEVDFAGGHFGDSGKNAPWTWS